jgi:hypothetical protein
MLSVTIPGCPSACETSGRTKRRSTISPRIVGRGQESPVIGVPPQPCADSVGSTFHQEARSSTWRKDHRHYLMGSLSHYVAP